MTTTAHDGATLRSYLYGADAAAWLVAALVPGEPSVIRNLGSPQAVSFHKSADMIAGSQGESRVISLAVVKKVARSNRFVPYSSEAEGRLNVFVDVDLRTAVTRTIQWLSTESA